MGGAWIDQLEAILITDAVNLWFSETLSTRAVYELAKSEKGRERRERERERKRERERERGREREREKEREREGRERRQTSEVLHSQSKHLKSVYQERLSR